MGSTISLFHRETARREDGWRGCRAPAGAPDLLAQPYELVALSDALHILARERLAAVGGGLRNPS
jgi:hypothetical protein